MAADITKAINQSYFDFYLYNCLRCFNAGDWNNLQGLKNILQTSLIKFIDVKFSQNEVKAHLLLIIDFLEELFRSGLLEDKTPEKQERDELLVTLEDMQSSLNVIKNIYVTNCDVTEAIRKSLFYNYVVVVQIWIHSRTSSDMKFNVSVPTILKKMKNIVKVTDDQERKTFALFELIYRKNADPLKKPGYPRILFDLVKDLVSKICGTFEPPEIIEIYGKRLNEKNVKNSAGQESFDKLSTAKRYYTIEDVDHFLLLRGGDPNLSGQALMEKAEKIRAEARARQEQQENDERSKNQDSEELEETTESDESINLEGDTFKPRQLTSIQPKRSLLDFGRSRKPPSHDRRLKGKWTTEEENDFIRKTLEIGPGQWLQIKTGLKSLRSTMQLKDKWRNISKGRKRAIQKELDSSRRSTLMVRN